MGEFLEEPELLFHVETCFHIHGERWRRVDAATESERPFDRVRLEFSPEFRGNVTSQALVRLAEFVQARNTSNIWLEFNNVEVDVFGDVIAYFFQRIRIELNIYLTCVSESKEVVSLCGNWVSERPVVWLQAEWKLEREEDLAGFLEGVSHARALRVLHFRRVERLGRRLQSRVATDLLNNRSTVDSLVFFEGSLDRTVIPTVVQALGQQAFPGGITIEIDDDEISTADLRSVYNAFNQDVKIRWGTEASVVAFFVQGRHKILFKTHLDNGANVRAFMEEVRRTTLTFPLRALDVVAADMAMDEYFDCYICHDTLHEETTQQESYQLTEEVLRRLTEHGIRPWIDKVNMRGVMQDSINRGLDTSSRVIILLTRRYLQLTSDANNQKSAELNLAILKRRVQAFILVVMDEHALDRGTWVNSQVGQRLAGLRIYDLSSPENMANHIDQLVACINH